MMRRPSTTSQLYAWHRAAVAGLAPAIHDSLPECGWYKLRLVKGGPWVAVEITIEREIDRDTGELTSPEKYRCEVDGQRRDPAAIWTHLRPITRAEFYAIRDRREAIPAMAATMARFDLTSEAMRP